MFSSVQILVRQMFLLISRSDRIANASAIDNTLRAGGISWKCAESEFCRPHWF